MSDFHEVEKKAQNQAEKHFRQFMDDCEWPDMLEKYADIANRFERVRKELSDRHGRGARLEASDFADFDYYEYYYERMARVIANNTLASEGYERDKKGYWILKNQPEPTPKKKFGFWG